MSSTMLSEERARKIMDFEAVEAAIRHANEVAVAPKFGSLLAGDVSEKSPGEVVTVADRACEELLSPLLRDIVDAPVVGEEQSAADPATLDGLNSSGSVWLVDPIDGTANFAAGSPEYALMVGFVERGEVTAAWIFQPQTDVMAVAALGAGATRNGMPVTIPEPTAEPSLWRPVIKDRFLPPDVVETVAAGTTAMGPRHSGSNCAGFEYPALVAGEHTLLLYWRTLPWDHGPGALYASEAGCAVQRPNGDRYSVAGPSGNGSRDGLVVCSRAIVDEVRARLFGARNGTAD